MPQSILKINDPEAVAIRNRLGKTVRWLGEHVIPKDFLQENYGGNNAIFALLDDDPKKEVTLIEAISLSVFDRAMKGDVRALEFIRDIMGEKPATNVNVTSSDATTTLSNMTLAQLIELRNLQNGAITTEAEPVETPSDTSVEDMFDEH